MAAIVRRICPLVEAATEVALVVWVELAALVVWAESAELAALVVWAESAALAALVVWVELAATDPRLYRRAGTAAIGSTIQNIAAAPRTGTEQLRIDSEAPHVAIHSRIAKPAPVNRSGGRVAIWRATALRAEASVADQAAAALATGAGAQALATARGEAEPTV
jgi:hypothetical protein